MTDRFSHRERIEMLIRGEKADRFAASVWRHFYNREASARDLTEAMLEYQKKYDWDFMKINPRASYHAEPWGNRLEFSTKESVKHRKIEFAVKSTDDWGRIDVLPMSSPVFAEQLEAIRLIKGKSDRELPLLFTIFTPVSVARYLVGSNEVLSMHLAEIPGKVEAALENITETFENFAAEVRNAGADGIFFATTHWASSDMLTWDEYLRFGKKFDLRVIRAAGPDALNLFHVCASNNYLERMTDYPGQLVNWDSFDPTNLTLEKGAELFEDRVIVGGLDHTGWLKSGRPEDVISEMSQIKKRMAGERFMFGPGCTIGYDVPEENLRAVRDNLGYK
jgi:uroporphyrinogen decarboxylase